MCSQCGRKFQRPGERFGWGKDLLCFDCKKVRVLEVRQDSREIILGSFLVYQTTLLNFVHADAGKIPLAMVFTTKRVLIFNPLSSHNSFFASLFGRLEVPSLGEGYSIRATEVLKLLGALTGGVAITPYKSMRFDNLHGITVRCNDPDALKFYKPPMYRVFRSPWWRMKHRGGEDFLVGWNVKDFTGFYFDMFERDKLADDIRFFIDPHGVPATTRSGEKQSQYSATTSSSGNHNVDSHSTNCPNCTKPVLWVQDSVGKEVSCYICGKIFMMPVSPSSETGKTYTNASCNFSLAHPSDWKVEFENRGVAGSQWTETVRLVGPMGSAARPYLTVVTALVKNDGKSLAAYMDKAEQDLSNGFSNLRILSRQEGTLLGWPTAWMTYTYQGDSGSRQEMNVTTFFGREWVVWFQFICETDVRQSSDDFPIFERIVRSLRINSGGLRLDINLVGPLCVKCHRPGSTGDYPKPVFDPTVGNVIPVCDRCWKSA